MSSPPRSEAREETSPAAIPWSDGQRWVLVGLVAFVVLAAGCASSDPEPAEQNQAQVVFDSAAANDTETQRSEHTVTYDPDERPTRDLYEEEAARPDGYTVHDLLVDLEEETDTHLELDRTEAFGYQLVRVDGVPDPGSRLSWALYVDGDRQTAGIGTILVEDDATYEWRLQERATDDERDAGARASDGADRDRPDGDGEEPSSDPSGGETRTRQTRMVVDYNGFRDEAPQRTEHEVTYDPDARPTAPRYHEADTERPDAYVLHDLVSDWSNQTGNDHIAREDEELGFVLQSLDGVTAHSTQGGAWTWQLTVDGEDETASLNAVRVDPGSTYTWSFERVTREGGG